MEIHVNGYNIRKYANKKMKYVAKEIERKKMCTKAVLKIET